MSRSFLKFLKPLLTGETSSNTQVEGVLLLTIGLGVGVGHCTYSLGTVENKIIQIDKKYQFDRNGFTEFMIIDKNGRHYNVNNSLWHWKWNSIEDFHKLEQNKDIVVKYYGWRVPSLGIFPNIVMSRQDQVLDSMSSAECRVIEYKRDLEKQKK